MIDIEAIYRNPSSFPYYNVVREFRSVGKHFVSSETLDELAELRRRLRSAPGTEAARVVRFLNIALDKFDGRYEYPTYIALDVLPMPDPDNMDPCESDLSPSGLLRDHLFSGLMADLVAFELGSLPGALSDLPGMKPDANVLQKRLHLAVRSALPSLARLDVDAAGVKNDPERFADEVLKAATPNERQTLEISMLPVYTLHDEYLFIRVLQSYESMFALLAIHLRAAIFSAACNYFPEAIKCVTLATQTLTNSKPMFSLLATMQKSAFSEFRKYTDGASAIQSRNYKTVESLCREPDPERLHSIAYGSVPEVQRLVLAGQLTLAEAVQDVRTKYALDARVEHELLAAMTEFGEAMSEWRRTHYKLARHFLALESGEPAAPGGTGGTEGTGYLDRVRSIPIFRDLDSARVDESAAIADPETTNEARRTGG